MDLPEPIPINALLAADDAGLNPEQADVIRDMLASADIVLARDVMTGGQFIVYGRDLVQRVAETGDEQEVRILHVAIDHDERSDDLEKLCALVKAAKGRCDMGNAEESS